MRLPTQAVTQHQHDVLLIWCDVKGLRRQPLKDGDQLGVTGHAHDLLGGDGLGYGSGLG